MDGNAAIAGAIVLAAGFGSAILTVLMRDWLRRRAILDQPGERSSHATPVPRGAGLAVIAALVFAWLALAARGAMPPDTIVVVPVTAALALLSFADDLRGLPIALRLAAHFVAALIALALFPRDALIFQGLLPLPLDRTAAALLWVWFINLYNFMDGIDGITGVETICLGAGIAAVSLVGSGGLAAAALVTVAAALGFLRFNWQPASVFLGDAGSVPLGYVMGWLLLVLARDGHWASALILPLYYLADATVTLARRARRGEAVWRAHHDHFYQRALRGNDHAAVARLVLAGDIGLIVLALLALDWPLIGLGLAVVLSAAMLAGFARRAAAD